MAEWIITQYAAARADLILVNVNPGFQRNELEYCINKVGIKTLVMSESFKSSNYIEIVENLLQNPKSTNPLDLGNIPHLPSLKNIVLIGQTKNKHMVNFEDL